MSVERDPQTDSQDAPIVNDNKFIQDMVIEDIEERKQFGIRKYGTALQAGNGRNHLQDAYEEVLDLVVYLRGVTEEERLKFELDERTYDQQRMLERLVEEFKSEIKWYDEWTAKEKTGEVDPSYVYDMAPEECEKVYFQGVLSVLSEYKEKYHES